MASMISGTVTFNAVSDTELAKALELKAKHQNVLMFNPAQLEQVPGRTDMYNHMIVGWTSGASYEAAHVRSHPSHVGTIVHICCPVNCTISQICW